MLCHRRDLDNPAATGKTGKNGYVRLKWQIPPNPLTHRYKMAGIARN
jgi:hypothetical protein